MNKVLFVAASLPYGGGSLETPSVLITTDSTQHTIDTTTLYTIDNNNTTT